MYKWPPHMQDLGDAVKKYIDAGKPLSISDDRGIYRELEEKFAALHGRNYALLCSSGTAALFSAYFALDLREGDEIICTAVSFHATASPALFFKANIVFCDVESDTGNIDVALIENLITQKTRAVVTNDQWGHPCDKKKILELCRKNNLKYIEDCSHAHFARYEDKFVGTFGDIACWSFQGSKMLNGGEGGILLTNDFSIYERAVLFGHYSWRAINTVRTEKYLPINATGFGLKFRMHPLAAVIILHELENYVQKWIKARTATLSYFETQLLKYTPLLPMAKKNYVKSMGAWYGFYPRADFEALNVDKNDFTEYLKKHGLEVKLPTNGILPYLPIFRLNSNGNELEYKLATKRFLSAEKYFKSIIGFPTFSNYETNEIDRYIKHIANYFGNKNRDC